MAEQHETGKRAIGKRVTRIEDLAVLCPTCHRWAHVKAGNRLHPLPAEDVRRRARLTGSGTSHDGFSCRYRSEFCLSTVQGRGRRGLAMVQAIAKYGKDRSSAEVETQAR